MALPPARGAPPAFKRHVLPRTGLSQYLSISPHFAIFPAGLDGSTSGAVCGSLSGSSGRLPGIFRTVCCWRSVLALCYQVSAFGVCATVCSEGHARCCSAGFVGRTTVQVRRRAWSLHTRVRELASYGLASIGVLRVVLPCPLSFPPVHHIPAPPMMTAAAVWSG